MIRKVLPLAAAFALTFFAAVAQEPVTALSKHLSRIDIALSGVGIFNKTVSGPLVPKGIAPVDDPDDPTRIVSDRPSNTLGALFTIRYIAKPYFGLEFNTSYARFSQNFSNVSGIDPELNVQANVSEYTFGYVVNPPHPIFGFQPFVSAGAGTTKFKPTLYGGEGIPASATQARATYYYSAGIQKEYFSHVGFRASFRQSFLLVPDFGQNYLTIKQRTISTTPTLGVYLKF